MARRAPILRVAFPAGAVPPALALLLSACAGPQRPAPAEAAGAPPPPVAQQAGSPEPVEARAPTPPPAPEPRSAREWALEGVRRERAGDPEGARAAYASALDADPKLGAAAQNLARLDLRRGRAAEAEQELRSRLERSPAAAGLRNALAELDLAAGRLDAAEEEARRALKDDERHVPSMVTLATIYHRKSRNELARMVLENARQIDDRDPSVWNRLGFVELALGNRPQALEDFRTAAALGPAYAEAHANYGAMLADAGDHAAAVTELELAVKYAPDSAAAWLVLGNAYRGEKDFEKAEEAYGKAAALDPALADVSFNLAVLYLDGDKPGVAPLARLEQAVSYFDAYEARGGKDARLGEYRKDAARAIDREKKRLAREQKDRLRQEAEARKKEDAARKDASAAAVLGEERSDR